MFKQFCIVSITLLLACDGLTGQTKRIDSLKLLVNTAAQPDEKLNLLLTLCREKYSLSSDSLQ